MASENLAKLQATVNRYAPVVGFAPLQIDGGMGDLTYQATQFAVEYAIVNTSPKDKDDVDYRVLQSLSTLLQQNGQQGLMENVQTLNTQLARVADSFGLQRPQSVAITRPPMGGPMPDPTAFKVKPAPTGITASLLVTWHKLPTWGQITIGAAGAFGVLMIATAGAKKKQKQLTGGRW